MVLGQSEDQNRTKGKSLAPEVATSMVRASKSQHARGHD